MEEQELKELREELLRELKEELLKDKEFLLKLNEAIKKAEFEREKEFRDNYKSRYD